MPQPPRARKGKDDAAPAAEPTPDPTPQQAPPAPEGAGPDALLTAALAAAQLAFPHIEKRHTATVTSSKGSYSYSYADLADVLNAVRPVLAVNGLTLTQHTKHQDNGTVLLTTKLAHVAGGLETSEIEVSKSPGDPQQFGGALTYLRRYEVVTLLGIAAEQDLDAGEVEPERGGRAPAYGAAPDLPASLTTYISTDKAKREFSADLIALVGRERATVHAPKWAKLMGGGIPAAVAGVVKALRDDLAPATEAEQAAEAARAAQDAAAEAPQAPAAAGPPSDVPAPAQADFSTPPEARQAADRFAQAKAEGPPPPDTPPMLDVKAEDELARLTADRKELGLDTTDADRLDRLNELGCTCPDPLGKPPTHSEACPFPDHGIPF